MPKHRCPFPACAFETTDVTDELAAVLLTVPSKGLHSTPPAQASQNSAARVEKVRRPTITSAGTSEEWPYFITHWQDYAGVTKVEGKDK
eukprot:gene4138-4691_t